MNKIMNSQDMSNLNNRINLDNKGRNQNRIKNKTIRECKTQDILQHKHLHQHINLN